MLTGDIDVSEGDAYLDGFSVMKDIKAVSLIVHFQKHSTFSLWDDWNNRFKDVWVTARNLMQQLKK